MQTIKTVFILGAGASKKAGVPLMANFLDVAYDLWKLDSIKEANDSFQRLFNGVSLLQRVHSKSQLDIHNIESVFASFDMADTLGRLAEYNTEQISELVAAVKTVIVKTIEHTLHFPVIDGRASPPPPYDKFIDLIRQLRSISEPKHSVSIITFNYDLALDYSFHNWGIQTSYNIEGSAQPNQISFSKLHGSINWGYCANCKKVVPWSLEDFFGQYHYNIHPTDTKFVTLDLGSMIKEKTHDCGTSLNPEPILVPPTWNKGEYHRTLSKIWSAAASDLSEAENIFVIGYSLPETDQFFRYLYALGSIGYSPLSRFWVFNPEQSGKTENRFRELLGPAAEQRFLYHPSNFEHAITIIDKTFAK